MKFAIINNSGVISNIVIGDRDLLSQANYKWLSASSRLKIGDEFDFTLAEMGESSPDPIYGVVIDHVSGQLDGYANNDNEFTVPQQSNDVIAMGQLSIPDRKFKVPFKRIDTGRIQLMPAQVQDEQFSIPLKFETNGIWIVNQELINSDFQNPTFEIVEYTFSVL